MLLASPFWPVISTVWRLLRRRIMTPTALCRGIVQNSIHGSKMGHWGVWKWFPQFHKWSLGFPVWTNLGYQFPQFPHFCFHVCWQWNSPMPIPMDYHHLPYFFQCNETVIFGWIYPYYQTQHQTAPIRACSRCRRTRDMIHPARQSNLKQQTDKRGIKH